MVFVGERALSAKGKEKGGFTAALELLLWMSDSTLFETRSLFDFQFNFFHVFARVKRSPEVRVSNG